MERLSRRLPAVVRLGMVCAVVSVGAASAGTLYLCDRGANSLFVVNTTTGAATEVGPFGPAGDDVGSLAYDPNTGTMYGINSSANTLITIDIATGAATSVGPLGYDAMSYEGMAFDPNTNTLYATGNASVAPQIDKLFTLNTTTGAATVVGPLPTPAPNLTGLAFDPATNTLYGAGNDRNLHTVSQTTAELTIVGPFNGPTSPNIGSTGFALDTDTNTFYLVDENTDRLYTVDISTGQVTEVAGQGSIGLAFADGLAFVPSTTTGTVPALSPAGLLVLVIGLALMACFAKRPNVTAKS